ncbi:hypothetical protein HK098_001012 [Nowakowskiella sp. JEL0407]|nr:hypothetical protein HK098_001012 [Nowakowskiella sp. JEL0407]
MACYYKFDGWFFNIEAIVPSPVDARNLVLFLDYMTKEMHRRMPGSYVIWYDSLTINGELRWQNYLNHNNLPFFLVTDGIYTNYGWNAAQPFMSAELANKARDKINVNDLIDDIALNVSNVEADASTLKVSREIAVLTTVQRFLDAIPEEISNNLASYLVFTGTDVYGRGTYGGGGFNCHKALRISNDAKTSGAIFGLGWTYDNVVVKPDNTFTDTERRFWYDKDHRKGEGSFAIGCEKAGEPGAVDSADSGCIANEVKVRPVAMNISNSFYTNFDRGIGRSYSIEGMIVDTNSWTHIGRQHPLPTYPKGQHSVKAIHSNISSQTGSVNIRGLKSEVKGGDCWRGGSAFVVSALRNLNQTNELNGIHTIDLYESEIALSEGYIIDVKCNRQEGVQIGLVIKLKLRKMGGVETLDERVVFPESKLVSRQWESMELDLSKLLDAERQNLATVVSFGIAVAGCSVVKKGSYQNLQDFKGVTDLGEDFSETGDAREMFELCRVGEIRIYKKADIIPHHLDGKMNFIDIDEVLVGKNEDAGETIIGRYLTLTWTVGEQHQLDEISWEVYVNEKWVGTAFVNRYRIGPIFESGALKFLVKGFDDIGQIRLTSSGEYIFE